MTELRALTYIEIDIKYCSLTYGTAPCTASLGVTGSEKCFNVRCQNADCQDPANFTASTKTLRFGLCDRPLPADIDCIPILKSARVTNAVVKPGESIGERAKLTANFINCRHGDAGIDKYIADRSYNPFDQGTFWGKFRARNTYIENRPIRIYRGYEGEALEDMDCEHFVIEKMQGPNGQGNVSITGVDFMRLLNSEKAQAPTPNNGYLDADITDSETAITLLPAGIGNDEYPASGKGVLGKEIVSFTRSGDNFTITRAQDGTTATEHDEGDTLQVLLEYSAQRASVIINDLIVNYSPLDSSYTDVTYWTELVTQFADVLYSRQIPKPTPVVELINEFIEQAGLVMFGNTRTQQIEFDILRPNPATGLTIGPDEVLQDSFDQVDQPSKRYSSVWVFYGKRDIFETDEPTNYYSAVIQPVEDDQYETPAIKKIFSKWIPSASRSVAQDVAARAIARYKFPPLKLIFSLFARNTRQLGQVVDLTDPSIETATGEQGTIRAIITGWTPSTERHDYEAEEYNIDTASFAGDKIIQLDYDTYNVNLRTLYDTLYGSVDESTDAPDIIFIVNTGVVVGSTNTATYAMESGTWPAGVEPILQINSGGYIVGRGGSGGSAFAMVPGYDGGPALRVTSPIRVDNNGVISGGGGGGGPATAYDSSGAINALYGGGGGAGRNPGGGQTGGATGNLTTGGAGSPPNGGNGGDLGEDGEDGFSGSFVTGLPGGAAGVAVDGDSLVTYLTEGDIRGSQIN